jgi:hypothetical protein
MDIRWHPNTHRNFSKCKGNDQGAGHSQNKRLPKVKSRASVTYFGNASALRALLPYIKHSQNFSYNFPMISSGYLSREENEKERHIC